MVNGEPSVGRPGGQERGDGDGAMGRMGGKARERRPDAGVVKLSTGPRSPRLRAEICWSACSQVAISSVLGDLVKCINQKIRKKSHVLLICSKCKCVQLLIHIRVVIDFRQ